MNDEREFAGVQESGQVKTLRLNDETLKGEARATELRCMVVPDLNATTLTLDDLTRLECIELVELALVGPLLSSEAMEKGQECEKEGDKRGWTHLFFFTLIVS